MIRFLPFVLAALVPVIGERLAASDWLAIPLLIVLAVGLWMIAPGDAVPARADELTADLRAGAGGGLRSPPRMTVAIAGER